MRDGKQNGLLFNILHLVSVTRDGQEFMTWKRAWRVTLEPTKHRRALLHAHRVDLANLPWWLVLSLMCALATPDRMGQTVGPRVRIVLQAPTKHRRVLLHALSVDLANLPWWLVPLQMCAHAMPDCMDPTASLRVRIVPRTPTKQRRVLLHAYNVPHIHSLERGVCENQTAIASGEVLQAGHVLYAHHHANIS